MVILDRSCPELTQFKDVRRVVMLCLAIREFYRWRILRSAPNSVRPPQFRAIHGQSIPLYWQSEGMTQQGWMTHRMDGELRESGCICCSRPMKSFLVAGPVTVYSAPTFHRPKNVDAVEPCIWVPLRDPQTRMPVMMKMNSEAVVRSNATCGIDFALEDVFGTQKHEPRMLVPE